VPDRVKELDWGNGFTADEVHSLRGLRVVSRTIRPQLPNLILAMACFERGRSPYGIYHRPPTAVIGD
jgi:hypothetical protein